MTAASAKLYAAEKDVTVARRLRQELGEVAESPRSFCATPTQRCRLMTALLRKHHPRRCLRSPACGIEQAMACASTPRCCLTVAKTIAVRSLLDDGSILLHPLESSDRCECGCRVKKSTGQMRALTAPLRPLNDVVRLPSPSRLPRWAPMFRKTMSPDSQLVSSRCCERNRRHSQPVGSRSMTGKP